VTRDTVVGHEDPAEPADGEPSAQAMDEREALARVPKSHSRVEGPGSERTLLHQRVRQSGVENRVDSNQVVALLRHHYAEGRLTLSELEERTAAAYQARTREQLRTLTTDLPTDPGTPTRPQPRTAPDPGLLCLLLCVCPPAGIAYWLLFRHRDRDRAIDRSATSRNAALPWHVTPK
jgi:hypothetical protein